jgi:hypothetical protein
MSEALFPDFPVVLFDGEKRCPDCSVIICAHCQGLDPDCTKGKLHAADCTFVFLLDFL